MLKIPPELDFTSEQFDPALALAAKDFYLPYPKVKIYDNLADWYSHAFNKKKNDILSNQESKTASKNNCYVLKRNYEWYYHTLGLDLPHDFDIQSRYKKYTKRKRNFNGKYQIDKRVVFKEMPSEMLQPMRSSKILIKSSDGSLKDFVLVSTDSTSEKDVNFENSNTKDVNSNSGPDPKLFNRRSELSGDSVGDSANFSESEIQDNAVSTIKEGCIFSEKINSPSLTIDCTNTLSKSTEISRKDIDLKNDVFDDFHHKAVEDNSSLYLRKHKSSNESIHLKKHVRLQSDEILSCVKDNSKSAVLPSTGEMSISAPKESSNESPDFENSGFSKITVTLPNVDKPVNIQSTSDNGNSSPNVSTLHLTDKVSDKTSNSKHKKPYSRLQKTYSVGFNNFVLPNKLHNEKKKRFNKRKFEKTLVNFSPICESSNTENKLSAFEDASSANTLVCKASNKIPDLKLYKCNSLNKVIKKKSTVKSGGLELLNKKKEKYGKKKSKVSGVTVCKKIKIVNNALDVSSTSPACVNPNITPNLELKNSSNNLQAKQSENSVCIVSSFIKSPYNKGVYCKSDQHNSKSVNSENVMKTENSNTKYLSCITNKTLEVEKDDGINLEANSVPLISNSTLLKKLPCERSKMIKTKSPIKSFNVLNKVESSNTSNVSRKSFYALGKLNKRSNFEKNNYNLQDEDSQNPVGDIDILFNLQDGEDINSKKNLSNTEVFNYSSSNEAGNSPFIISEKSVSTCKVDKAHNLEFKKCNSLSPQKNSLNIPSIILVSPYDKENKHTNVKSSSVNADNKLENKNCTPESERLFSPLKSLNKIPDVEFKKCDNCPRESRTDCYINKSSIVKSPNGKGNSKELALLELARRARKRLHMQ